jgi:hypothetical protein
MTHIRWVYAAFIIDVDSRLGVGWPLSNSLHADLAIDTLERAVWNRNSAGRVLDGLVHHSDGDVQPNSTGRRNTSLLDQEQMFVQCFGRSLPTKCLAAAGVERCRDGLDLLSTTLGAYKFPAGILCADSPCPRIALNQMATRMRPECHLNKPDWRALRAGSVG